MDANHIHDALAQVREVRQRLIDRQRFLGYSAGGRFFGGAISLGAAWVLSSAIFPQNNWAFLGGWCMTAILAAMVNYGLCMRWYWTLPGEARQPARLLPLLDTLPPLLVAAGLTAGLAWRGHFDLLYGAWMCLFGLVNFYSYHHLPRSIRALGMLYVCSGILLLVHPAVNFLNPWPMALVFLAGETIGGWIVRQNTQEGRAWGIVAAARRGEGQS